MRTNRTPASNTDQSITDYRYTDTRKNNPPAGIAAQGKVKETPRHKFAYNPHRPPVLRFDPSGKSDALPELLAIAKQRRLTDEEAQLLADALRNREPWLEWAGKREAQECEVDPVALHIHERVSSQAILRIAARQDIQRNLFADPEQDYREAVQFYQHDVAWANRLILGDSLAVMASLAKREDLAGKVQMIYIDPPYGIKYASNFQNEVGKRDVKDKEEDLTREQETVKAYRDTWTLGVHSYLAYLRDRLYAAKELLTDSGSIFVQISDENLHRVRMVMDEVFGTENFLGMIVFATTSGQTSAFLSSTTDNLLWYAKNKAHAKYRHLYEERADSSSNERYNMLETSDGCVRSLSAEELELSEAQLNGIRFRPMRLDSAGERSEATTRPYQFREQSFSPLKGRHWTVKADYFNRLDKADRLTAAGNTLEWKKYYSDFALVPRTNVWLGTMLGAGKVYVVQTATKVIERCLLMTTDPGDLVLDPTCGSGTTAYVAEQWGRRWITADTSRVAVAIARQRLLTAKYDFYKFKDEAKGVSGGFVYKTVPHITLKSIAQNQALDPIFEKYAPQLEKAVQEANYALAHYITPQTRNDLRLKLAAKEQREGKKAVTDADRRRWLLPEVEFKEWKMPFDTDEDWPEPLSVAITKYRRTWRAKMDEVNACIAASAEQEELVDQPDGARNVLRVSGPFTVEGVKPAELSLDLDTDSPIGGEPDPLDTFDESGGTGYVPSQTTNAEAYLDKMIRLLRADGVRFPENKVMKFTRLAPLSGSDVLHAEGEWQDAEGERSVAVVFGPQYGPITAEMVENCLRAAHKRRIYDDLVFAGFAFDAAAQGAIDDDPNPKLRCHTAYIRPDVNMGDLLKDTPNSQLFTVSGLPRVTLKQTSSGEFSVIMEGVDIYNPVDNSIRSAGAEKVAAWFVDSDYDGQCFCICQAFFPDAKAWDKLSKALTGVVDPERFAAFAGTQSLPFPAGKHGKAAVKVIDPRGNEVMRVLDLSGEVRYA